MANRKKRSNPKGPELVVPDTDLPKPEAANWFHFARAGNEFQMLLGYIDVYAVHRLAEAIKKGGKPFDIKAEVTHRVLMSERAVRFLKSQVDEIVQQLDSKTPGETP